LAKLGHLTWKSRTHEAALYRKTARSGKSADALADIVLTTQSVRKAKSILFCNTVALSLSLAQGFNGYDAKLQEKIVRAFDRWDNEFKKQQEDPEYVPSRYSPALAPIDVDLCTRITRSTSEYYLCRNEDCHWVGLHGQWIQNVKTYNFMCPMCGQKYAPWKVKPNWCYANMVWVNDTDQFANVKQEFTLLKRNEDINLCYVDLEEPQSTVQVKWPGTETSVLLGELKAVIAEASLELQNCGPEDAIARINFFEELKAKAYMKKWHNPRPWVAEDSWNQKDLPDTLLGFKHIPTDDEVTFEYRDLVRVLALANGIWNSIRARARI